MYSQAWFYYRRGRGGDTYTVWARTYSSDCRHGWTPIVHTWVDLSASIRVISISPCDSHRDQDVWEPVQQARMICLDVTHCFTILKLGRTVAVYVILQRSQKDKDSRYIEAASAPAAAPCIRPLTSLQHMYTSGTVCYISGIMWLRMADISKM